MKGSMHEYCNAMECYINCYFKIIVYLTFINIGHVCDTAGCKRVIVFDGNMKNAREVCACNNDGELFFSGMEGSIVVGK